MTTHALVELSGGYDSALSVLRALDAGHIVTSAFVDYGQPYLRQEKKAMRYLCTELIKYPNSRGCQVHRIDLALEHNHPGVPRDYIPARNFAIAALMVNVAESVGAEVIMVGNKGAVAGGGEFQFPDAGAEFFQKITDIARFISYQPDLAPRFEQNLLGLTKADVVRELLERGISLRRLWNCYTPGLKPCRSCHHCTEMWGVLQALGQAEAYTDWWGAQ